MKFLDRLLGRSRRRDDGEQEDDVRARMRSLALGVRPDEIGLAPAADAPIYGVVLETGFPTAVGRSSAWPTGPSASTSRAAAA